MLSIFYPYIFLPLRYSHHSLPNFPLFLFSSIYFFQSPTDFLLLLFHSPSLFLFLLNRLLLSKSPTYSAPSLSSSNSISFPPQSTPSLKVPHIFCSLSSSLLPYFFSSSIDSFSQSPPHILLLLFLSPPLFLFLLNRLLLSKSPTYSAPSLPLSSPISFPPQSTPSLKVPHIFCSFSSTLLPYFFSSSIDSFSQSPPHIPLLLFLSPPLFLFLLNRLLLSKSPTYSAPSLPLSSPISFPPQSTPSLKVPHIFCSFSSSLLPSFFSSSIDSFSQSPPHILLLLFLSPPLFLFLLNRLLLSKSPTYSAPSLPLSSPISFPPQSTPSLKVPHIFCSFSSSLLPSFFSSSIDSFPQSPPHIILLLFHSPPLFLFLLNRLLPSKSPTYSAPSLPLSSPLSFPPQSTPSLKVPHIFFSFSSTLLPYFFSSSIDSFSQSPPHILLLLFHSPPLFLFLLNRLLLSKSPTYSAPSLPLSSPISFPLQSTPSLKVPHIFCSSSLLPYFFSSSIDSISQSPPHILLLLSPPLFLFLLNRLHLSKSPTYSAPPLSSPISFPPQSTPSLKVPHIFCSSSLLPYFFSSSIDSISQSPPHILLLLSPPLFLFLLNRLHLSKSPTYSAPPLSSPISFPPQSTPSLKVPHIFCSSSLLPYFFSSSIDSISQSPPHILLLLSPPLFLFLLNRLLLSKSPTYSPPYLSSSNSIEGHKEHVMLSFV